jgi:hypothetical protein
MRRAIVRFMFFKSPSERFYSPFYLTPRRPFPILPNPTPHTTIYNRTQQSMNDWKFTHTSHGRTSRSQNVDYRISITDFLWLSRQTDLNQECEAHRPDLEVRQY